MINRTITYKSSEVLLRTSVQVAGKTMPIEYCTAAWSPHYKQESRAVARKLRDAAAVLFGLKLVDNIHYKSKSSQASKAMPQSSKHSGEKHNLTQNGHSR